MQQQNEFFKRVYKVVRKIPYGKGTTYGSIAQYWGAAKSARMVGYAMNSEHARTDLPARRVVNRIGRITGKHHFVGITTMQQLLDVEGHVIIDDQIQHFDAVFWNPNA